MALLAESYLSVNLGYMISVEIELLASDKILVLLFFQGFFLHRRYL